MKRRDFITLVGGAAIGWPLSARAQEPRRVIGVLSGFVGTASPPGGRPAFYQGLKETGFVEGTNINTEFRSADGHYERLPSLAAELVGRNVAVIVAIDLPSAIAAKAATKTIPIVFSTGADPVKVGLVESLGQPNANLTGVSVFSSTLGPKRMEILRELLPDVNTIALSGTLIIRTSKLTCRTFGLRPMFLNNV